MAAAVRGVDSVVHAASDTHHFGRRDVVQTRTLLELIPPETGHFLYVSIVGIDAIPFGYYRRKLRCEDLVSESSVPSTILRATQFHELAAMAFGALERSPVAPLPSGFRLQPVAAREVAERVVDLVGGSPVGRADDFGGPEVLSLAAMAEAWRVRRGSASSIRIPSSARIHGPSLSERAQHLPSPGGGQPNLAGVSARRRSGLTWIRGDDRSRNPLVISGRADPLAVHRRSATGHRAPGASRTPTARNPDGTRFATI